MPDADSFDDLENVNPNTYRIEIPRGIRRCPRHCAADGKQPARRMFWIRGPERDFTRSSRRSYCVRVETSGLVPNLAIRLNPGYFITDTLRALGAVRFQFDAGEGSLCTC